MSNKMFLALFLAIMPTTFACQLSMDTPSNCQIGNGVEIPAQSVVIYDHMNFIGDPLNLSHPQVMRSLNGEMSSLKVPPGYEVILFEKEDLQGSFVVLSGEIPNLFTYLFNDRARSLIYHQKTRESQSLPRIFTNPNYSGQETFIPYGLSEPGKDVLFGGSIKVPDGLCVILKTLHGARFKYEQTHVFTSDSSMEAFIGDPIISVFVKMV